MTTRIYPHSFTMHLTLLLCAALSLGSLGWWAMSTARLNQILAEQVALRAQVQSQQLSQLPSLLDAVARKDTSAVTEIIEGLQNETDADFITVSDVNGIRLAHPVKSRIGFPVVGGDIEDALENGQSYLSHSVGSLGPSVRYITPLFGTHGEIIGMIKVGYLKQSIAIVNDEMLSPLILFTGFSLLISGLAAWRFSRYVGEKMQRLEPWQLQQALQTNQGVLQAAHEGLVAVNTQGDIYLINDSGRRLLGIPADATLPSALAEFVADADHFSLRGSDFIDRLVRVNGVSLVLTRVTLRDHHTSEGAVFSLRAQKELQLLSNKISQVSSYMDSIRVTRHEYQNKLSTVTGLLQLGHVKQALDVLLTQAQENQANMDRVAQLQSLPLISGVLLANLGKAAERGIHVELEELHGWKTLPNKLDEQTFSSLVANLMNNSIDALADTPQGYIRIVMYQTGSERVFSVANNGPIVNVGLDVLCRLGYTTKTEYRDHGVGMHLVQSIVEDTGGYMELDSDSEETVFAVYWSES